ncbi:MAG TPA: 5'-nucleotidase C-terminal domain-containing protein [Myxococcaceae bacterium]
MNRHTAAGLRRAFILGAFAFCSSSCIPLLDGSDYDLSGQQVRLTVLHTSDIHSRLLPYDFSPIKTDTDLGIIPDAGPFGGATRMAAVLKRERAKADRVIHLDSGDSFQGAPIFNVNFGEAEFKFLSLAGLDAAALGNHEFDAGAFNFVQKTRDFATFPVLASNLIWYDRNNVGNNQASQVTSPYVIRNVKGLKVGIIGMGNVSTLTSLTEGGNSIQATPFEQNEAARAYVELLRPLVDLVVITSHLGLTEDQDIVQGYEAFYQLKNARPFLEREQQPWEVLETFGEAGADESVVRVKIPGVSGIDAIFGGHLHVVLNPPQTLTDPSGRSVLLTHSGAFAKYVGRLDMVVQVPQDQDRTLDGAEIASHDYQLFKMDSLWCDDAMRDYYKANFFDPGQFRALQTARDAMAACTEKEDVPTEGLLQKYVTGLDFALSLTQIYAYAPRDIVRRNSSTGGDSPLGNLTADSMRVRQRVQAEMSLTNTLGIRDNLYAGPINQESMFNVFPFENTINVMYLSGKEMQELFDFVTERSSSRGCQAQAQISGARFQMDCAQAQLNFLRIPCSCTPGAGDQDPTCPGQNDCPTENREGRAPWQCLEEPDTHERRCWAHSGTNIEINGAPLYEFATYKIAVNDYIAKGGSGFQVLKRNTSRQETYISLRDSLIGFMQNFCTCADFTNPQGIPERCERQLGGDAQLQNQLNTYCRETQAYSDTLVKNVPGTDCACVDALQKKTGCDALAQDAVASTCNYGGHHGPYLGRCSCYDALSGNPVCGFVTTQARNFCLNATAMPIAVAVEDARITRRVK